MSLRRLFLRWVDAGEIAPRFYGVAWYGYQYGRQGVAMTPIPFNVLIGFARWVYFAFVRGFPIHHNDKHAARGQHGGFWRHCYCTGCGRALKATAEDRAQAAKDRVA